MTTDARRSTTVNELVATKERERQLELELRSAQDQLRGEQSRVHSYMDKVRKMEVELFVKLLKKLKLEKTTTLKLKKIFRT